MPRSRFALVAVAALCLWAVVPQAAADNLDLEDPDKLKANQVRAHIMDTEEKYAEALQTYIQFFGDPLKDPHKRQSVNITDDQYHLMFDTLREVEYFSTRTVVPGLRTHYNNPAAHLLHIHKELKRVYLGYFFFFEDLEQLLTTELHNKGWQDFLAYQNVEKDRVTNHKMRDLELKMQEALESKEGKIGQQMRRLRTYMGDQFERLKGWFMSWFRGPNPAPDVPYTYQVMPITRIPEYRTMLKNILDYLDPTEEAYGDTKKAIALYTELARELNDAQAARALPQERHDQVMAGKP